MNFPIDFNSIRKALCNEIQKITAIECVEAEPEQAIDRRPKLPYFTVKLTTPAAKTGDDSYSPSSNGTPSNPTTEWNWGGTRRCTASFQCYATTHELAYMYASMVQAALDTIPIQYDLRAYGIAVWQILNVTDVSQLLNTGYEGRAALDVYFGIVSNTSGDLGAISEAPIHEEIISDSGTDVVDYTITEE